MMKLYFVKFFDSLSWESKEALLFAPDQETALALLQTSYQPDDSYSPTQMLEVSDANIIYVRPTGSQEYDDHISIMLQELLREQEFLKEE